MQESRPDIIKFINLQLAAIGQPIFKDKDASKEKFCDPEFEKTTRPNLLRVT